LQLFLGIDISKRRCSPATSQASRVPKDIDVIGETPGASNPINSVIEAERDLITAGRSS
jgi:hypothetical protein